MKMESERYGWNKRLVGEIPEGHGHIDECGVITEYPYWGKIGKVYTHNDKYCESCLRITKHENNQCVLCGKSFTYGASFRIVH